MSEYPCRTKEISGIEYHVTISRDGKVVSHASGLGQEASERLAEKWREISPENEVKVYSTTWTRTVCIECGNESY